MKHGSILSSTLVQGLGRIAKPTAGSIALIATLTPLVMSSAASAQPTGFNLAWSDEFNGAVGSQPNSSVWGYDTGAGGWGNNEIETYVTSQANCHIISDSGATDGLALQIEAQTDSSGRWYSARINTGGKKVVGPYGYVEYRAQLPNSGDGYWPAAWMLGENIGSVGWPQCGEVDILEEVNGQNINHGSLHGPNNYNSTATISVNGLNNSYHTYGALWQPGYITFYVDGNAYETQTSAGASGWVFDNQTMFFIINLAIGGNFPGSPDGSTQANGNFKVDYVRLYEQGAPGSPATGGRTLTPQCATGSRLDLTNGSTANGNKLQIWQAAGNSNQTWNLIDYNGSTYEIQSSAGNVCLDSGGATSSGSAATVWQCNGNGNQLWTATSYGGNVFSFMDANAGLCLDVAGAGSANGTAVQTYACNGTNAQKWAVN